MMRRGVSPIVATVLLIIIAVAAGVLIWVWLHGFASKNPTVQPVLNEKIRIDSVEVTHGASAPAGEYNVTVFVRNIGGVITNVTAVYLYNPATGTVLASNTSVNVEIAPGQVVELYHALKNVKLTSSYEYGIKVVTKDGVTATYTFIAP